MITDILLGIAIAIGGVALVSLFILPTIFWILMLIDCINRDFKDKLIWIVLIVCTNLLGAILYYYCVKNKK